MMEVISTRRYEARPPANTHSSILVDPENSVALVKEEEWETRKKKEITTTRQIETRVKRQVVLEDGEVVVDSGPLVTTNTTEDVEQQEHTTQERRTTGDQPQEVDWPAAGGVVTGNGGNIVQKELNETVVRSREEIEERLETEDRQQLGDISDEAYQKAVRSNRGDLRVALAESSKQLTPQSGPRVIQHTTRSNKVIDTEKTLEKKELKADGLIVTEKKRTVEHEEINDDEVPDDGRNDDEVSETKKESSQRYVKRREEDVVDYISAGERVGREMRYVAETTEGERIGDWSPSPTGMRTTRLHKYSEKQNHARSSSPVRYTESPHANGHAHGHKRNQVESSYLKTYETFRREYQDSIEERQPTPSPPIRRRSKEQWAKSEEKVNPNEPPSTGRTSSPVHVVQRTWESRSRDAREQTPECDNHKDSSPRSRSISPKSPTISRDEKKSNTSSAPRASKSSGYSKYKIGESFRRLVGKLRSASTERKHKRVSSGSTSQLTQTDDNGPTYMQYNVIDRNIPLVSEKEIAEEKPPERPPRSPRNADVLSNNKQVSKVTKTTDNAVVQDQWQRSESTPPLQRYYLGEDPFGGSIYGREKGYEDDRNRRHGRPRKIAVDSEHSVTSSSLGRFSKSTSRLAAGEHEREEHFRSTQTLPRNLHSGQSVRSQVTMTTTSRRRDHQHHTNVGRHGAPGKASQHGSMINISIKNTVTSSPKVAAYSTLQPPPKPGRTYRSSLSRSKSFNVEADKNGVDATPSMRAPYISNLHLNRLNETPPLKSPGILASISRSNRDLFRDNKY
ncbi:serine/arginine repetitive matrix protein 1 isoform X3 [Odontomachus brunneus]|uniref:serine/arginine repetitive matrix protein 1 isoform X3 n=1 Tax=Odontomachus brunneus TaxID=486640 RepID=UPI0013F20407|nr:serine/arginine repetitive matrix protein 1 isoform X3 [Odontomachus brunneus]